MKRFLLFCMLCWGQWIQAADGYSLYDTIRVIHNQLHIDLPHLEEETLRGRAEITVCSKQAQLSYAPLLLLQMQIDSIQVNGVPVTGYQYNDTLLRIPLPSPLSEGEKVCLSIAYHGTPFSSSFGGMVFTDSLQMVHTMGVSLDEVPHSFGRSWFPAIDDFRSRSTFDLYIQAGEGKTAVASGLLIDTIPAKDGTTTWHWRVNQPIPDYLVSLAVAPYQKIHFDYTQADRTLPIDIYVLPGEAEAAQQTYAIVPKVLEIMEKKFGPYRFDRVGYVSVNSPGGAMEHVTNIAMPRNPHPVAAYQLYVIHELIHSWFGNQVTCATAADMWLNEGITSFLEEVLLEELFSPEIVRKYARLNHQIAVLEAPRYDQAWYPLSQVPSAYTYSPTVYYKGARVMHALRNYLGDDLLFPALKKYVETYTFRSVTTPEFEKFLSSATGKDLTDFFDQWVNRPGFPAFEIDSIKGTYQPAPVGDYTDSCLNACYKGTLYIEQKLFGTSDYGRNIPLPVTFYDHSGRQNYQTYILVSGSHTTAAVEIPFEPSYVLVDPAYELCKASTLAQLQMDTLRTYSVPACKVAIVSESLPSPADLNVEFYAVAPDPVKQNVSWQLSGTHYWRFTGNFPSSVRLSGQLAIDKIFWDKDLFSTGSQNLLVLYRTDPADDWKLIRTLPVKKTDEQVTVENLKIGEYCLAVDK